MRNLKLAIALCASLIALVCPAAAQSYAKISQPWFMQGKIAGGVSVTATTPSPATTLPTPGQQAWVCNTGSNDAYLAFGSANTVASSTTTGSWLKAGTCWTYDLNAFSTLQTFMAAVTATSTTTLTVETGIGTGPYQLSTSGGGGGGSVNVAQWGGTAIAGSTAWGTAPTAGSIVPNMNVNCVVGCAGGTTSNASSGVATSATNGASVAYNYGFNGATWDQLQVDASKSLKVNVITSALPTGAATAALQPTNAAAGSTTSGQTGNLLMGAVVASATYTAGQTNFATIDTAGLLRVNVVSGGGSNASVGATGSTAPTSATLGGMVQSANLVALTGTAGNLNVQCANCSGSGVSTADGAAFSAGSSLFVSGGGIVQTTSTSNPVAAGNQGLSQMTQFRASHVNLRNASGAELGTTTPLSVGGPTANGTAANSPPILVGGTAGGTSTGAVSNWNVGAAGTGIIDAVAGGQLDNDLKAAVGCLNATNPNTNSYSNAGTNPVNCNLNGNVYSVLSQGGSALSATNGLYTNLLQGNAALSPTNPIFNRLTDGTTASTIKPASTPSVASDTALVVDQRPGTTVQSSPGTLANGATLVKGTVSAAMTGTSPTQVVALVATKVLYITRTSCKGDPTNAVGTKVQITDGSGGAILDTMTVGPSGGGEQATGATPLYWTTAGNGLYAQNVTTGASVICTASGYSG